MKAASFGTERRDIYDDVSALTVVSSCKCLLKSVDGTMLTQRTTDNQKSSLEFSDYIS